jgi:hypothetical protein
MTAARTFTQTDRERCAHAYQRSIGPYLKCTACGLVTPR